MTILRVGGTAFQWRVTLDKSNKKEKLKWCQENIISTNKRELLFVPPWVPKETAWFPDSNEEQWLFKREEDAVLFEMTWGEWSGS